MSRMKSNLPRRNFLVFAAATALLPLAACQTATRTPGKIAGGSASASANLQAIRSSNGLGGLKSDPGLERAAEQQAGYMASAGRMSHSTSWSHGFASRMRDNNIHGPAAENIAKGHMTLDEVFARWMASPPHRRNMLDPQFTRFGLAYAQASKDSPDRYWALVLAA